MTTKRMMRWVIVLLLLAALPVMTAVMAQEQEPATKQLPVMAAEGESQAPLGCNLNESEPNNERGTADVIGFGDVICAHLESHSYEEVCGDDWFRFHMPNNGYVLIDAQAPAGSENNVTLYPAVGGFLDSIYLLEQKLLFYNLHAGDYYILVDKGDDEGCTDYSVALSRPLLVSAAAANLGIGNVAGIPFRSEDILAYSALNNGEERWEMFFDGSDVGVKTLINFAADTGDRILITTGGNQTLPGVGPVAPWDIVIFDPGFYGNYGEDTWGTFQMGLDGSEHQLTMSGEKLDAIEGFTMGIESDPAYRGCFGFPVSTTGVATVNGPFGAMKQDDEDVFCKVYNPNYGGWQHWDWFFDVDGKFDAPASEPAPGNIPGLAGEDVYAMAYNDISETIYLTILGNGKIAGHNVTQKDIFAINYPSYTWGGYVWRGPQHGWNYNIDAIEYNGW